MSEIHSHFENLKTVGGMLCLDFANTVSRRDTDAPNERLFSYDDLVAWAEHVEIISAEVGSQLHRAALLRPVEAEAIFRHAVDLREALFRIFDRIIDGAPPDEKDVAVLNANATRSCPFLRLVAEGTRFEWRWVDDPRQLDCILWPVVRSATEALTSGDLDRVRVCAGEHCGWLFVDHSKNRSRRWCDMQDCGNVEKVRRYRRRQKEA